MATQSAPSLPRNAALTVAGEALWGFHVNLILPATVLVTLLQHFGATKSMLAGVTAIEAAGAVLPQLLGAYLFRSRRHQKRQLLLWHFLVMIPFLPLAGVVALGAHAVPPAAARWALLAAFAGFVFAAGTILGVWWDWMAHLFPQRVRGTIIGVSFCAASAAGAGGAVLAASLIDRFGTPTAHGILYIAGGLFAFVSISLFIFIRDPAASDDSVPPPLPLRDLLARFRHSLNDPNFRAFLIGRFLGTTGFCVMPLITAYYTSPAGGSLPPQTIVRAGAAIALATAATNLSLGFLGDRIGHRFGIMLGAGMQVVTLAVVLTVTGHLGVILAYTGAGICMGAAFIAHNNLLFETCPHDHRIAHITVGNLVLSPGTILAPLLAGYLATLTDIRYVFIASIILSAASLLWFAIRLRNPRHLTVPLTAAGT